MSSGARHGLGVVIGLIVTPLIAVSIGYGMDRSADSARNFLQPPWSERLIPIVLFLFAGLLLGLVMGSRLSPLAALIPGAVYTGAGLLWLVAPRFSLRHTSDLLPNELSRGYVTLGAYGVLALLGVALLVSGLPLSRWRAAQGSIGPSRYAAPMGPAPMGPAGPGMAPQGFQPQGAAPFAPPSGSPTPPPPAGAVPYGAGAETPEPPSPGSPKPAQEKQQPGEWTQMYGGDDLRGGQDGR
ncbi:hypothetical protein GCM10010191_82600 [Actinomadura vinacea]|uniref:Uncharacterized protein n=1 Tax=Actinomadura vinacea TaxID=115336 RepID=A0ABN3K8A2_9ACTN